MLRHALRAGLIHHALVRIQPGHVYVAPGSDRHMVIEGWPNARIRLVPGDPVMGHRPSVDLLFQSVAQTAAKDAAGAILTGMGKDGAHGLRMMREAGAATFGQDRESCVVYGMPRAAYEAGAVAVQLPLDRIAPALLKVCGRHA